MLPSAWRAHPFSGNHFVVSSKKQIRKLKDYGIVEVLIDEEKGVPSTEVIKKRDEPEKDFSKDYRIVAQQLKDVLTEKAPIRKSGRKRSIDIPRSIHTLKHKRIFDDINSLCRRAAQSV